MTSVDNVNSITASRVQNESVVAEVQSKPTTQTPPFVPGESLLDAVSRTDVPPVSVPANNASHESGGTRS